MKTLRQVATAKRLIVLAFVAMGAAACDQDQEGMEGLRPQQIRDSAGGGNGIRSHVLIGVQGVP